MLDNYWWSSGAEANGGDGVEIGRSLRFGARKTLTRTGAALQNHWTASWWFKYSVDGGVSSERIMCAGGNSYFSIFSNSTPSHRLFWTPTFSPANFGPSLRDPSAWYHVVLQSTATASTVWLNGEVVGRSGTAGTTNLFQIIGSNTNANNFEGLMSDWYVIDGQALQPEAFGRTDDNGVWVPREVDFTPATMRFSDMVTFDPAPIPNAGGAWNAGDPTILFNGNDQQFIQTTTGAATNSIVFEPVDGIQFTTSVEIQMFNNVNETVQLNNNAAITLAAQGGTGQRVFLAQNTAGTLERITCTGINGGAPGQIWVDGNPLLNPFIWSGMLFSDNVNSADPDDIDFDSTAQNWSSGTPANGFNGSEANFVQSGGTWIFRPNPPIENATLVEVFQTNSSTQQQLFFNSANVGRTDYVGSTWTEVYNGAATTINNIAGNFLPSGGNGFAGIRVNGQVLIDGVNNSYGAEGFHLQFADPDDLGHDNSGNENDFTPNNFVTDAGNLRTELFREGFRNFNAAINTTNLLGTTPFEPATQLDIGTGEMLLFRMATSVTSVDVVWNSDAPTISAGGTTWAVSPDGTANSWTTVLSNASVTGRVPLTNNGNEFRFIRAGAATGWGFGSGVQQPSDQRPTTYDLFQDSPTQNYAALNPNQSNIGLGGAAIPVVTPINANLQIPATSDATSNVRYPSFQIGNNQAFRFESFNPTPTVGVGNPAALALVNTDTNATRNVIGAADTVGNPPCNTAWYVDVANQATYGWNIDTGAWINGATGITNANINDGNTQAIVNWSALAESDWYVVMPDGNQGGTNTSANIYNFGQQGFQSPAAVGFVALQTQNLPAATIRNGRDHFQAITGPGSGPGTPGANQRLGAFSPFLTPTAGPSFPNWDDGNSANAFDGVTNTFAGTGNPGSWMFAPDDAIDVTTTVSVFSLSTAGTVSWNNQTENLNGGWVVLTAAGTVSSTNPITATTVGAGQSCFVNAIRIDGDVLVDGNILAVAQQTFGNGLWWIKSRVTDGNTNQHQLVDSVRGAGIAFQCPNSRTANYIAPAGNSVAWCWNLLNTPADNGFNIIEYTGNSNAGGTNTQNVAHNLGGTPDFFITFRAGDTANARTPWVWHGSAPADRQRLQLNDTTAGSTLTNFWGQPTATDLVFGPGDNTNANGFDFLVYAWRAVPGYSAFGSYQSSTNPPFIYTGFKPAFILIKRINNTEHWQILDSTRNNGNPANSVLQPSATSTEDTRSVNDVDFLSNGFRLRNTANPFNNGTYVYCCFAEHPFGSRNTSPATAR